MKNEEKYSLEQSLIIAINRLKDNKKIPKYQFERAVDVLISPFLSEWLSENLKLPVEHIINEFPIKKSENNQSTNVDYLMKSGDCLIFLELKTDLDSLREEQVEFYRKAVEDGISKISVGLKEIHKATRKKDKYDFLKEKVNMDGFSRILVVFVTPSENGGVPSALNGIDRWGGRWFSIEDFFRGEFETSHPRLWELVKTLGDA